MAFKSTWIITTLKGDIIPLTLKDRSIYFRG